MPPASRPFLAVIPAHNEAARIAEVVKGASRFLPALVVDDGSTDGTAEMAEQAGATVIRQAPNRGKGAALRAGFRHALAQGYDAVATLDGDGQHDPAELPNFLAAHAADPHAIIIGQRDFRQMPTLRRVANSLGQWAFSWAAGQPVADNQSGYRLLPRQAMETALASQETGFQFEVETLAMCLGQGMRLKWIPIRTIYDGGGSHIRPLRHLREFVAQVWRARRLRRNEERLRRQNVDFRAA